MKLFKKPSWLRPEINEPMYWLHIFILAIGVQFILNWFGHNIGTIFSIHTIHIALAISLMDIIAHSVLKLN